MGVRNKKGQFKKGHKGQKPKGAKNFNGLAAQLRTREPEILDALINDAISGKNTACLLYLSRKMYGMQPISNFKMAGSASDCMKQIIEGVGSIPPEILSEAAKLVESKIKVDDLVQMKADIEEIKKSLESNVL